MISLCMNVICHNIQWTKFYNIEIRESPPRPPAKQVFRAPLWFLVVYRVISGFLCLANKPFLIGLHQDLNSTTNRFDLWKHIEPNTHQIENLEHLHTYVTY